MSKNIHNKTVSGFGDEWSRFDQSSLSQKEKLIMFNKYFHIFPWNKITGKSVGFDMGCGSGRWAELAAPRVGKLHCIDPSSAIEVAKKNILNNNCVFHQNAVDNIPLNDNSMDFGYCLGVLHHIPNTQSGLDSCVKKLKPGAPFLIYIYYSFENRPLWFRLIWKLTNYFRFFSSRLPMKFRYLVSQLVALFIYYPVARTALIFEKLNFDTSVFPLNYYRKSSFYTMRTDALDRFGTILEKRFTKTEVERMMQRSGLVDIIFSNKAPFWTAVGFKKK